MIVSLSSEPVPLNPYDNPLDLFLWQNRNSDLKQLECSYFDTNGALGITTNKQFCIDLQKALVTLSLNERVDYHSDKLKDSVNYHLMQFDIGQERIITNVFNKFLEWDAIATKNHTENFQKEIGRRPVNKSTGELTREVFGNNCVYTFEWENGASRLNVNDIAPYSGYFDRTDVIYFQTLMTNLPSMKEKLRTAIKNREAQKDLFK